MGGNSTTLKIESKVWKKSFFHENYTNNFDRDLALVAYQKNEYLSLGKINIDLFKQQFGDEFALKSTDGFYDAYRQSYSTNKKCCLIEETYFVDENYKINSCDPQVHTFNSNLCDETLYETCLSQNHFKCKSWIRSVVELHKMPYFDNILNFIKENRNNELSEYFIDALYDFANDKNKYYDIVDSIINSYPKEVKNKEYTCAFPSSNIINLEKELGTPKECWYKDCVLSPTHKLLSSNYYKRSQCHITICDINVKNLNISNNKIEIICKNTNNNKVNLLYKNPVNTDKEDIIYIPTYLNTVFPLLIILSLLFIKV